MKFAYISAKEAAAKIGVTVRLIQQLCKGGKAGGKPFRNTGYLACAS